MRASLAVKAHPDIPDSPDRPDSQDIRVRLGSREVLAWMLLIVLARVDRFRNDRKLELFKNGANLFCQNKVGNFVTKQDMLALHCYVHKRL